MTRRQLREGDYIEAQARLDACRWDLRGWEHDYLQALLRRRAQTLYGHTNFVLKAVFSPDGSRVASASYDGTVRIWDLATGVDTLVLRGHGAGVRDVAYFPDGKRLISASMDGTLKLWDAGNGRVLRTLKGHDGQVAAVAVSADGALIASGSADRTIKLWDASTGEVRRTLNGHKDVVLSVAFSPDGLRVASSSSDTTARVWDVKTGKEALTLTGHTARVYSVAFRPDGKRLATGATNNDSSVRMWDAADGKELFVFRTDASFAGVAFSPDGRRLAGAGDMESVTMWDAENGKELLVIQPHTRQSLYSIAFSPDGQRLVCANYTGAGVQLYDIRPLEESSPAPEGAEEALDSSLDGKRTIRHNEGQFEVWDTQSRRVLATFPKTIESASLSVDGQRVIGVSRETSFAMHDSVTGGEKQVWKGIEPGVGLSAVSSDLSRLAVLLPDQHTVQVHDLTSERKPLTLKKIECQFGPLFFRSDGKRLATPSTTGDEQSMVAVLTVWDTDVGQEVFTVRINDVTRINSVTFSADGKRIAAGCNVAPRSADAVPLAPIKVLDAETGRDIHALPAAAGFAPTFSPDGRFLAAVLPSKPPLKLVKIWEVESGKELRVLSASGLPQPVHFSRDSKHLFALGTGEAWDVETGKPLPPLRLPGGTTPGRVGFDGRQFLTSVQGVAGVLLVWDAVDGRALQTLQFPGYGVAPLGFSADKQRLLLRRHCQRVKVWDAATGKELVTLPCHFVRANRQTLTPDGRLAAVATPSGGVMLYDAGTAELVRTLKEEILDSNTAPTGVYR